MFTGAGGFVCDHGELTPAEMDLARRNFKIYDADGDGVVTREDFGAAMVGHDSRWADPAKKPELDEMYAAVDTNGSGRVGFTEFAVMRVLMKHAETATRLHQERTRAEAASTTSLRACSTAVANRLHLRSRGAPEAARLDAGDGKPRPSGDARPAHGRLGLRRAGVTKRRLSGSDPARDAIARACSNMDQTLITSNLVYRL